MTARHKREIREKKRLTGHNDKLKTRTIVYFVCYLFFLYFFFGLQLTITQTTHFKDYYIYLVATGRHSVGRSFYRDGFIYLPSFFYLSFIINRLTLYLLLLFYSLGLSIFLMYVNDDHNYLIVLFANVNLLMLLSGNIEPFLFFCFVLSYRFKENSNWVPILSAFCCFKLSYLLSASYLFFQTKNKFNFIVLFTTSLLVFNSYFITNPEVFREYLSYSSNRGDKFSMVSLFMMATYFVRPTAAYTLGIIINSNFRKRMKEHYDWRREHLFHYMQNFPYCFRKLRPEVIEFIKKEIDSKIIY